MSEIRAFLLAMALIVLGAAPVVASTLEDIQASGQLRVGVKADVMPWGFRERPDGPIVGMEPDLAALLARRLGVKLVLVAVESSERIEALNQGRIDVLIATFSDTPERKAQVTMVYPSYYASGVNLLSRKEDGFKSWSQLLNRRVCGRRGSFYNRPLTLRYGMDVIAFHSLIWAKEAVRDGRCSALLYDDIAIIADLRDPNWSREFEMSMPSLFQTPWSIALPRTARGSALQSAVSEALIDWHREGVITSLEKTWLIPATAFAEHMHQAWSRRKTDGGWYCGSTWTASLPPDCVGPRSSSAIK
ncbi:MAG: transporter substrate-binding domain-containing protein [Burkholderiales bacterium]|jgi:polar amino acid transport system substrate-binding protein